MRCAFALVLFGFSLLNSGCALLEDATRNSVQAIRRPIAEHHETARNRRWAEAAWINVCSAGPTPFSTDHADGFKLGYAEYLFRGGDGEPPLVAPLRYRNVKYQTPEGFAAIQAWFNGYRHGASIARESGARQWVTGPSALPANPHAEVGAEIVLPAPTHHETPIQANAVPAPPRIRIVGIRAGPVEVEPDPMGTRIIEIINVPPKE
jgi:hypothetical protein